jgi:glycosyltransferase involved in cell wall biosynthesis
MIIFVSKKMEIVVNTRLLIKNKLEGIGWFSYETLKRITQSHPEHHFIFLFDRNFDEEFLFSSNITPLILSPPARHPFLFYWWFEHSVANFLNKYNPDLFLSPDGYLSLRAKCKQLAVIHDINFEHHPKDLSWLVSKYYRYYFPKFANKATRIATVSEYSKSDIVNSYNISPTCIDVIYNGSNESYKPISNGEKKLTRQKISDNCDYFLFVGSLQPRKNIARLLEAFDKFKASENNSVKMVIVGEKYRWTKEIKSAYVSMKFKKDVIFTGRLNARELHHVIGSALAMTYVPYFEGFGIPILEAMNCEVPVITSNITSMPEVAQDAALLVDPFSPDAICNAMVYLYKDEDMRKELIQRGKKRKLDFSWNKTAEALWKSIENTVNTGC